LSRFGFARQQHFRSVHRPQCHLDRRLPRHRFTRQSRHMIYVNAPGG
jgi:hypothetical protein